MQIIKKIMSIGILAAVYMSIGMLTAASSKKNSSYILIIDPAGNTITTGRKLDDDFERGVTLQFAQELKTIIEQTDPHIRVVLTRTPGHVPQHLEQAQIANRVGADAFLSVHCFQETDHLQQVAIYRFGRNDDFIQPSDQLAVYRYDQAHLRNKKISAQWANMMVQQLKSSQKEAPCTCSGPFALPFKPLIGVISPAIALELSVHSKDSWKKLCKPVAHGIIAFIEQRERA